MGQRLQNTVIAKKTEQKERLWFSDRAAALFAYLKIREIHVVNGNRTVGVL